MQSIHTAKCFEEFENNKNKKTCTNEQPAQDGSEKHSVIRSITNAITEHAKDAILEVIQKNVPSPTKAPTSLTSQWSQDQLAVTKETIELQHMIERSLGVTALSMSKDLMIAGNMGLKNKLRSEMGGCPSTQLLESNDTVSRYRAAQLRRQGSRTKCSRSSRNELIDLQESSDDESKPKNTKGTKANFKKRVLMKYLAKYKAEKDDSIKDRIKYAMKALDSDDGTIQNEMIDFTFNVHTTDLDSFDSDDCASNILDFADDKDVNY